MERHDDLKNVPSIDVFQDDGKNLEICEPNIDLMEHIVRCVSITFIQAYLKYVIKGQVYMKILWIKILALKKYSNLILYYYLIYCQAELVQITHHSMSP